jgi:excisionase family DNA binding protein
MERTVTPPVVATALGVTEQTVRNWLRAGNLKGAQTPGGHWRIRINDLREFKRLYGLGNDEATERSE